MTTSAVENAILKAVDTVLPESSKTTGTPVALEDTPRTSVTNASAFFGIPTFLDGMT